MPNDPDSRSPMLNSVLASGSRASSRPPSRPRTSGWTVKPSASPRPHSSVAISQTGVEAVSSSRPRVLTASSAKPPETLAAITAGPARAPAGGLLPRGGGRAHHSALRQQGQAGDGGGVPLDLLQEHRGQEQHGEQHHARGAAQQQGPRPAR